MSYHRTLRAFNTLQKLAASLEHDAQTSQNLKDVTDRMLAYQATLGVPHIPKHDEVTASRTPHTLSVARDAGTGRSYKQVLSQILDSEVAPAGEQVVHRVHGADPNERTRAEIGIGPKQRHTSSEATKRFPGGYSQESSFSSVKVAAAMADSKLTKELREKVRALKANKDALPKYRALILSEPVVLDMPLDALPEMPYPLNDSEQVISELQTIRDTMDLEPLSDDIMELADEEPLELFRRACTKLSVPYDEDFVPLLVSDLRRYAMALKYVYGRPRPYELAPYFDITIIPTDVDPYEGSPSYPSIHSTIGYGVANYYGFMYPQHAPEFLDVADTIAMQRVQSGHHYPSDNTYAKLIADTLLSMEKSEPAPSAQPPSPPETQSAAPPEEKAAQWQPRRIKILR